MSRISKSPDRHTFQKNGYIDRCLKENKEPNEDYLEFFEKIIEDDAHKFDDPESRVNNMEYDLLTSEAMLTKVRASESYAQNLYAALCNMDWQSREFWQEMKGETWSCSWRYAGGIIADMRQEGDYIDWYCSGMGGLADYDTDSDEWAKNTGFVPEGTVTEEIELDLNRLGWRPIPPKDDII